MKYRLLLITTIVLIQLAGCSHHQEKIPMFLVQADSLIKQSKADSALIILQKIKYRNLPDKKSKAYYALLQAKAKDRCCIFEEKDSSLEKAIPYFSKHNDINATIESHYYLGRIYQNCGKMKKALYEFLKVEELNKDKQNKKIDYLMQANLALLLSNHELYKEADSIYNIIESNSSTDIDSLGKALIITNRVNNALRAKSMRHEVALYEMLKANRLLKNPSKNKFVYSSVYETLGAVYIGLGKYRKAIDLYKKAETLSSKRKDVQFYRLEIATAFYYSQEYDSAKRYLDTHPYYSNYAMKSFAYLLLSKISMKENKPALAYLYEDSSYQYNDSNKNQIKSAEAITLLKDYVHGQAIKRVKVSSNNILLSFSLGFTFLLVLVVMYIIIKRNRERKKTKEQLIQFKLLSERLKTTKEALAQKEIEIKQLELSSNKLDTAFVGEQQRNSCLNELLEQRKAICNDLNLLLETKNAQIKELKKIKIEDLLCQTSGYLHIKEIIKRNEKEVDDMKKVDSVCLDSWIEELNEHLDNFTFKLEKKFPSITIDEIYYCCLSRVGFKQQEIAAAFACTTSAVYKRRKNLFKKLAIATNNDFISLLKGI